MESTTRKAPQADTAESATDATDATGAVEQPPPLPSLLGEAPDPLANAEHQRQRELMRARLFGKVPQPIKIGRFSILQRLGAGGMGVVYAAYDEQLDRRVALKLLRVLPEADEGGEAQARLLREAQALARLAHPNVVAIHEIGVSGGQIFIAMEFVQGQTLRAWLQQQPRSLAQVLGAYRQAGEGLRAAHARGLIHRDFKPENAMIGDDGRVRVVDFGLARSSRQGEQGDGGEPGQGRRALDGGPGAALGGALTTTGAVMGTPSYMAPEQHLGGAVDERTDQFSFCVALYEGLYGERPFAAGTLDEVRSSVLEGAVRPPPPGGAVPGWLRAVLLRGLRPRPDERWPSMAALLAALDRDPASRRRRAWFAGLGAAACAALVALLWLRPGAEAVCSGGRPRVAEVWGEPQRGAVRQALVGSGLGYAARVWARVEGDLDRYAGAWSSMHTEACLAHRRGEQSSELLDLRMACLERRRQELGALVRVLAAAGEPAAVEHAAEATGKLEPVEGCADAGRLRAQVKPPRDARAAAQAERLRSRLAAVKADSDAGLYERGFAEASAVADEAIRLGYGPLVAEALCGRGALESHLGRLGAAEASFSEAFEVALGAGDDATAGRAATHLLAVLSHRGRSDAAGPWERGASGLIARRPGSSLEEDFFANRAVVRADRGEYDLAMQDHERALGRLEKRLGPRHPVVALRMHNQSIVLQGRGLYEQRVALSSRALGILEESLGPEHPEFALVLDGLAMALLGQGQREQAIGELRRALGILERNFGSDHPRVVQTTMNLAIALGDDGQTGEALALSRRALAVLDAGPSPNHPRLARLLSNLSATLIQAGQPGEAVELARRAVALRRVLGADQPDTASALVNLGGALGLLGRDSEARNAYREALAIFEARLPPSHPSTITALVGLGQLTLRSDEPAAAVPLLERALAANDATPEAALKRASLRFALAKALDARARAPGGDPAQGASDRRRARELAELAAAEYEQADAELPLSAAWIKDWLRAAAKPGKLDYDRAR